MNAQHNEIQTKLLEVDPDNVRKGVTAAADKEMIESVKAQGILSALLVRPIKGGKYQVVAGHRRLEAAKAAGLTAVPCQIRDMTDDEAKEAQLVENLQREDLAPIDEAEAFKALADGGLPIAEIAAKTGKDHAYVHGRIGLMSLTAKVREAVKSGDLPLSWAVEFRRIAVPAEQDLLLKKCMSNDYGSPRSMKELVALIDKEYALNLARAAFSKKDPDLYKAAGSCEGCPKRTGAQSDLFGEASKSDLCLDGQCFRSKIKAYAAQIVAEAKAKGQKVLVGDAAKKLTANRGGYDNHAVRNIDETFGTYSGGPTGRAMMKAAGILEKATIVVDELGNVTEWFKRSQLEAMANKAIRSKNSKGKKALTPAQKKEKAEQERAATQRKRERSAEEIMLRMVREKLATKLKGWKINADFAKALIIHLVEDYGAGDIADSLGWVEPAKVTNDAAVKWLLEQKDQTMVLACALARNHYEIRSGEMAAFGLKWDKAVMKKAAMAEAKKIADAQAKAGPKVKAKKEDTEKDEVDDDDEDEPVD